MSPIPIHPRRTSLQVVQLPCSNFGGILPSIGEALSQPFHYIDAKKKQLANIKQCSEECDRAYIDRIDKLIMEGESLGDEAKVLGEVGGLKTNSKTVETHEYIVPDLIRQF